MFWTKPNEICSFPKWQNQPKSNKNRTSSTFPAYKICTKKLCVIRQAACKEKLTFENRNVIIHAIK